MKIFLYLFLLVNLLNRNFLDGFMKKINNSVYLEFFLLINDEFIKDVWDKPFFYWIFLKALTYLMTRKLEKEKETFLWILIKSAFLSPQIHVVFCPSNTFVCSPNSEIWCVFSYQAKQSIKRYCVFFSPFSDIMCLMSNTFKSIQVVLLPICFFQRQHKFIAASREFFIDYLFIPV